MTSEDRPGLKIRRKRDETADPEGAPDASAPEVPLAVDARDESAETSELPRSRVTQEVPATGVTKPADPKAAASAEDSRRSRAWRSDVAIPRMDFGEDDRLEVDDEAKVTEAMPTTDDFAAMLGDAPVDIRTYEVGDHVHAEIVAVGSEAVFVSLGGKAEGAIERGELCDDEGNLTVGVGDTIDAYVVSFRDGIRLSQALHGSGNDAGMLEDAQAQGIPVEGKVTGTNKGGYEVQVLGARAFCPFSQIDLDPTSQPEDHLGATYAFLVTKVEEGGRNVVVSRRRLLEQEREERATETLARVAVGAEFEGVVSRVADFGAFVDIGGVDGLVHVSEISHGRLDHPSEMVSVGDVVRVAVRSFEDLHDPKHRRIGLSMKALAEDPWVIGIRNLTVGDTLTGRVVRMESFGAFVELGPGLDGLVHISEIAPGRRINHPRDVLSIGDDVQVQVIKIDPARRQIGLSIKALMDDPWSVAAKEMPVGTVVQGTVESLQSFGIFVSLPAGITGLVPISQLPEDEARNIHTRFRKGTDVEARVLAVDPARQRLTLTRREDSEGDSQAAFASYEATKDDGASLGTFADLLKKRG